MRLFRLLACAVAIAVIGALPANAAPPAHRIVTLVPSLAEDLFAIGAGDTVVGVSAYTDYPKAAARLPVVASFAAVATERIVALRPDVVIGIPSQARQVEDLRRAGVRVVLVGDDGYDDIFRDLRTAGALTGRSAQAEAMIARAQERTRALMRTVRRRGHRPAVLVVLGVAPVYTVGDASYIARLIRMAGGRNAAAGLATAYGAYSSEAAVAARPDVLIVDRDAQFGTSRSVAPWNAMPAVRDGRVYTAPDDKALYRPGPRYNDGLAWLIGILNRV